MMYVDRRIGSAEFAKFLAELNLPIAVTTLTYGDFAFQGIGDAGVPVPIGIERKTIEDFTASMWSGRLPGHQLPGLLACYDDVWIVLEGVWRTDYTTGAVQVPRGKRNAWRTIEAGPQVLTQKGLEAMMLTLELRGGVRFRHTRSKVETGRFLAEPLPVVDGGGRRRRASQSPPVVEYPGGHGLAPHPEPLSGGRGTDARHRLGEVGSGRARVQDDRDDGQRRGRRVDGHRRDRAGNRAQGLASDSGDRMKSTLRIIMSFGLIFLVLWASEALQHGVVVKVNNRTWTIWVVRADDGRSFY